jgi:hypothetical protein
MRDLGLPHVRNRLAQPSTYGQNRNGNVEADDCKVLHNACSGGRTRPSRAPEVWRAGLRDSVKLRSLRTVFSR